MSRFKLLMTAAAVAFAVPAFAGDITITDPYARVSTMMSKSGAAFMVIENHGAEDDRMIGAASDIADRVELHTHIADANGVMQMVEVKEGFPVAAHGTHELKRGADHVMFLGLRQSLNDGDTVHVVLTFEKAGEIAVDIPVDLKRDAAPMGGMQMMNGAPEGMMPQHQNMPSN